MGGDAIIDTGAILAYWIAPTAGIGAARMLSGNSAFHCGHPKPY